MKPRLALLFSLTLVGGLRAESASEIKGFAPVSISAANYRKTSREDLLREVEQGKAAVNPEVPPVKVTAEPVHYVFVAGEVADSDLAFDKVTALLEPALTKKGYVNAADSFGVIHEPKKVTLVLRVSYGQALWRVPTVRTDRLSWADGMIARPHGTGLQMLGGETVFESRAGGNDDVMASVAQNASAKGFGSVSKPGQNTGGSGSSGAPQLPNLPATPIASAVEYGSTRDFNLIVVDAFDYQELKSKGRRATRVWSTFVAAPVERKQKFSAVAGMLVRNATPYFGETSNGLQVYTDARAEVKIGEIVEVKDEPENK